MIKNLALPFASVALIGATTLSASELSYAPLQIGYIHDFKADIDGDGSVSNDSFHLTAGLPLILEDDLTVALTGSFHLNSYDFTEGGAGSFSAITPWEDIHTIQLGSYIRWKLNDDWQLFATPSIRSTGEDGASLSDSLHGGAIIGASYKVNDNLTIGPGIGYLSQIEDSASIYPIILIDWQINDKLSLSTSPTAGANLGPGVTLSWDFADDVRFSFGVSYDNNRFRLDKDNAAAANGVGEDSSTPVFGMVTWKPSENLQTSIIAGVSIGNELRLEDEDGHRILERDYDAAPFLGFNLGYTF